MKNEPILKYCDYTLYDVFNCTTPELRDKVIDLWERNKALPEGVNPEERAYQVAIAVYDSNSEVIGVTTAYEDLFPLYPHPALIQKPYYYFRLFIQPSSRIPELFALMTNATYLILKERVSTQSDNGRDTPEGMAFVAENRKIMRPGLRKKIKRNHYKLAGRNKLGMDIYIRSFQDS